VVVDSIDVGMKLLDENRELRLHFVTRHGEHVRGPGIFQGGGGPTRAGSVLRREEDLERLEGEITRSSAELQTALAHAEALRAGRVDAQAALEDGHRDLREAEEAQRAEEAHRAEQMIRQESAARAGAALSTALEVVESELKVALVEAEIAGLALQSTDEEHGRLTDDLAREEADVLEVERERDRLAALHGELRIESTRAKTAFETSLGEIERIGASTVEAEREIAARAEESAETERRIEETHAEGARKERELTAEIERKGEKERILQVSREGFGAVKGSADDLETKARDLRREHHEITERLHRAELERAESEAEMRVLLDRVHNEYEVDLAAWIPQAPAGPEAPGALSEIEDAEFEGDEAQVPDEAIVTRPMTAPGADAEPETREERRERLRLLQEKVRSLGPVNLLAMQDYEERRQRLAFLAGQRKDLDEARLSLLEAIQKINQTAAELFQKTFEQVNENFQKVFKTLFEGGEAALTLSGEDPLEAEIDILARPRGKKPQSLSLLSGGEKALTAIALLFAIYLVKPSPFCILDEVDAPLDDANIDRFVLLLREFSRNTQFIVVTHNKKTMEVADCLYGVTMEEPGVSKLVSVRWNAEPPQEPEPETSQELAPAST
jgi:chromosome segregation protein